MENDDLLNLDYTIFNGDIKTDIAALASEVKKLVSFQEDLRQKNLIFERLNLVDKKLSAFDEALGEIRSDIAKLRRLCDGNKDWMEQIGGLVDHLLQCERNREVEEGADDEPLPASGQ